VQSFFHYLTKRMLIFKPWRNSRQCDNQSDPIHTKCRREMDLCRSIMFCGPETTLLEDTDFAHMPELQKTHSSNFKIRAEKQNCYVIL